MGSGRDLDIPPSIKCFATWILLATPQRKRKRVCDFSINDGRELSCCDYLGVHCG